MNILVFDTETISIEKPFCYDIGYLIIDTETHQPLLKRSFVVEQVWHNPMLYTTAYYADKREGYVTRMRNRTQIMDKWGYIMRQMCSDIKKFGVTDAYAYNSTFDDGVFKFNCDWFKTRNPFDDVQIHDIRGYVHHFIAFTDEFKAFCDSHARYTESGNYSTTAETLFQFISQQTDFAEAHTALEDSEIEAKILLACVDKGAELGKDYKVYSSIPRLQIREYKIVDAEGQTHLFPYTSKRKLPKDGGVRLTIKGEKN